LFDKFREKENYKNYKFNSEELDKIKIDLTFIENFKNKISMNETPCQHTVEYVKSCLICFPEIKQLLHVIKRFLQLEKLNSSFNGNLFFNNRWSFIFFAIFNCICVYED
jgi:hypothetical protein